MMTPLCRVPSLWVSTPFVSVFAGLRPGRSRSGFFPSLPVALGDFPLLDLVRPVTFFPFPPFLRSSAALYIAVRPTLFFVRCVVASRPTFVPSGFGSSGPRLRLPH